MNKVRTLFENKWVSLMEISNGVWTYVYSHETRCDGKIIALLPFRRRYNLITTRMRPASRVQYLLRSEITPSWGGGRHISSITGGVENNNPNFTALSELEQEAGYIAELKDLIPLGTCRGAKSTDTVYYLFGVDLTGIEKTKEGIGDGAELEKSEYAFWAEQDDILHAACPFLSVMYLRLKKEGKVV